MNFSGQTTFRMRKKRIKELFIHPAFISFILWLVVILLLPPLFPRYTIKQISERSNSKGVGFIYSDLDSDGNSEQISIDMNDKERTKIIISRNNNILDQYNIRFQPVELSYVFTEDYNHDGYRELFVFAVSEDSIFLNIIDPIISGKIIVADRFIDHWEKGQFSEDKPHIKQVGLLKNHESDTDDLVFFITTGYSLQPRNVYRYMIGEDSLIKSPRSGATIQGCRLADITNDGIPEILIDVHATGNQPDSFPFTDRFSWLMVLRHDLNFLFPPVRLHKNPSNLYVLPVNQNDETRLAVFHYYFGSENLSSAFCIFDISGNKIREKPVEVPGIGPYADFIHSFSKIFPTHNQKKVAFYFLSNLNAEFIEMDTGFNALKTIKIPALETKDPLNYLDADMDGQKEYIFHGRGYKNLIIVKDNFRNAAIFPLDITSAIKNLINISQVFIADKKPHVYLQFQEVGKYIEYSRNPFFYFRYLFYAAIYLAILAFIILLSRIQQYRLAQKQLAEKKMASLQMKAIGNQIDPHFTLNVLNAIGSLYATEKNRDKADYIFGKYARLIRQTVVSSDKVISTLGEEIDFVKNYVELEQFRSDYSFSYSIDIGDNVDRQMRIPRMLIHTFVENAIKYGIRNRTQGSFLKIVVDKTMNKCRITVEDNGPGLNKNEKSSSGTGKGLTILDELIDLYFRLEKSKIKYSIQNIYGEAGKVIGTRALIEFTS